MTFLIIRNVKENVHKNKRVIDYIENLVFIAFIILHTIYVSN